ATGLWPVDQSPVDREPKRPTGPWLQMVIVLLRSRRGRGFALLFSARWLGLATFSATRGSVGRLQVGSRPPLSGALIPRELPTARRRSCLLNRLTLLLPMRRLVGHTTGLTRNSCLMKLAFLLPVRRLVGDTAGLTRSWAANTALELASVFAAWGWHPFGRHSWPTGRRGRCDLLARLSLSLPPRGPRRR